MMQFPLYSRAFRLVQFPLRTAIIKDGILHVRAGAGIVMDSVPQMEFEETLHKSAALFRAAEQSVRFETVPKPNRDS